MVAGIHTTRPFANKRGSGDPLHTYHQQPKTMTKTESLQKIVDQAVAANPDCHLFYIEYRRKPRGYFAIAQEPRWIGDTGEFLGTDYFEAKHYLRTLLP